MILVEHVIRVEGITHCFEVILLWCWI